MPTSPQEFLGMVIETMIALGVYDIWVFAVTAGVVIAILFALIRYATR